MKYRRCYTIRYCLPESTRELRNNISGLERLSRLNTWPILSLSMYMRGEVMNKLSVQRKVLILNLLAEGSSMNSITRTVGVSCNTVNKLLRDAGQVCGKYHDRKVRGLECQHVQCDEAWSFCYAKEKNIPYALNPPPYAGDMWTWIGLDEDSRLIVAFEVGDRSAGTALDFTRNLQSRLVGRVQITTDGHKGYIEAIQQTFNDEVDYSQLVKMFDRPPKVVRAPDGSLTLKSKRVVGQNVKVIFGNPDVERAGTSYVERQNLTMRMSMKRFTRRSNAFSRTLENHIYEQCVYFTHYNFMRIHDSLGVTPAMAAGLTSKPRSMEWLVRKIDKAAPKPNRPKRYKKRNRGVVNGL